MQPKRVHKTIPTIPGEKDDIRTEAQDLIENADEWLRSPNSELGGKKPEELIGTDREIVVRNMLRAYRLGMFS